MITPAPAKSHRRPSPSRTGPGQPWERRSTPRIPDAAAPAGALDGATKLAATAVTAATPIDVLILLVIICRRRPSSPLGLCDSVEFVVTVEQARDFIDRRQLCDQFAHLQWFVTDVLEAALVFDADLVEHLWMIANGPAEGGR